MMERVLVILLV